MMRRNLITPLKNILAFFVTCALLIIPGGPLAVVAVQALPPASTFTILHTNDFHGALQAAGSDPGLARVAGYVNTVRTSVGAANMLLLDAGDCMQGSLLSNLWKGKPVIDAFNNMGYNATTPGNHDFDWGQTVLTTREEEANFPFLSANIVENDTGNPATAGWTSPDFVIPYTVLTVGSPTSIKVGVIGVTTQETTSITVPSATAGLCFKDPADSILHYYDEINAQTDVIVVLAHLGVEDGGYGYGFDVYGERSLAQKLIDAGKPVNLIIGGHSHTNMTSALMVGNTKVVQAYYNGRKIGRADFSVAADYTVTINWSVITVGTSDPQDAAIQSLIDAYATDSNYTSLINQPIGYVQTDLLRNYNGDSMMGDFVDDSIYHSLNNDCETINDVDLFFNNPGGFRIDWCDVESPPSSGNWTWTSSAAVGQTEGLWTHAPLILNYGQMYQILPFGNSTVVGEMTGAQILEMLNQSATLFKGAIQPAGLRYSFYRYSDALPGPQPWAWGAYDVEVYDKTANLWESLDLDHLYKVGTNEFLAPAGGDGFLPFKYMTDITYWGDMLDKLNGWAAANYTLAKPYKGPNGDGTLDGRITRDGTDAGGNIVPVTVLHHNDSHGNLVKSSYVGYTQLAAKITQERLHNPSRTLLLNAGDSFQGDSMMYYYRTAALGYAADGTPLPLNMQINPLMAAFNLMNYDAMTLGNHEFNYGKEVSTSTLSQANFPVLMANVEDTGEYGLASVPVEDYVEKTVGMEGIKVAILGIGNHRVPNYELPTNIPGLTFSNPLDKAQELSNALRPTNDVVLALTHIGFTENTGSVEVDTNTDTNMAKTVTGLDAIIGGHSHTDPSKKTDYSGDFEYLPAIIAGPGNKAVPVTQAYRYNNTLGEVVLGLRSNGLGGWEPVSHVGRYITITMSDPEDPAVKTLAAPYVTMLNSYGAKTIGQTTVPIDALVAFTMETNGANLQADACVRKLQNEGITVDLHLSGAMTNRKIANFATPATPTTLTVNDMFSLMPYENSLVVMDMNGQQLKEVLERAYRNYYYYKYVPGYGGYSYYTTGMLVPSTNCQIYYNDTYPALPDGDNVLSLVINGDSVNFHNRSVYYRVSTVNYLASGSCNFNDGGVIIWPLDQIIHDTQYYVRDAVIEYIQSESPVSPAIDGRLFFKASDLPVLPATVGVGGEVYAVNKTWILAPVILLLALLSTGSIYVFRRRRSQTRESNRKIVF
jgi:2',3'-cyclic-nucleotide 2'-phosphodiesterase (5'-nucleotidase family)